MHRLIRERARLRADNHRDQLAYHGTLGRLATACGAARVIELHEDGNAILVDHDGFVRPADQSELDRMELELETIARRQGAALD